MTQADSRARGAPGAPEVGKSARRLPSFSEGDQIFCFDIQMTFRSSPVLHKHPFHEFYFCLNGAGSQHTQARVFPMKRGDLFFFPAGQLHIGNGSPVGHSLGFVVNFFDDAFSHASEGDRESLQILKHLSQRAQDGGNQIPLAKTTCRSIRGTFLRMLDEQRVKQPGYRSGLKLRTQQLLIAILREGRMAGEMRGEFRRVGSRERLGDVYRFLAGHYMEPIAVEQMAHMAHMSRSHFHLVFRKETGRTLLEYVRGLRLEAAARQLRETNQPIVSIAYDCGFPCLSHFYSEFRRVLGQTPREMRMKAQTGT